MNESASEIAGSPFFGQPPRDCPLDDKAGVPKLPATSPTSAQCPVPSAFLSSLLLNNHNLASAIKELNLSASDLLALARSPQFKSDLADLRELLFLTARMQAVSDLQNLSTKTDDPIEQRRVCAAILRATSPALQNASKSTTSDDALLSPALRGEVPESSRAVRGYPASPLSDDFTTSSRPPSPPSSTSARCPVPDASLLPTHSATELLEHLLSNLQDPDGYADEVEQDLDDDDLPDDPRDHALLALHAAFNAIPSSNAECPMPDAAPPLADCLLPSASSFPNSDQRLPTPVLIASSPNPDTPPSTPASFDGHPVPSDPSAFLSLLNDAARDDLTSFADTQRHIEDDATDTRYVERVCFAHTDGRDVFRRFTFSRPDSTSPWRLTLVEPYDPRDIDAGRDFAEPDNDTS